MKRNIWKNKMGGVVRAWRVWAQRAALPLRRGAYGTWHAVLEAGPRLDDVLHVIHSMSSNPPHLKPSFDESTGIL